MKFVYILQSIQTPDHHYVGLTDDVEARLLNHNAGRVSHTSKFRPWRLKNIVGFADEARAAQFEKYLKSGSGRAFAKKKTIEASPLPIEDTLQARAKPRLLHLIAAAGMAAVCFWFAYHAMSVSADEFRAETLDNPRGAIFADVPAPIVAGVAALFGALCIWLFVRSLMQRIKKPIIFEADEKGVRSHLNGRARELAWSQIEQVIQVRGVVMLYGRDASETRVTVSLLPKQLDVPSSAFWNLLRERRPDLVK